MRVPKVIASMVARIAESTEAQPLMPQAHGTRCGALALRRASASGNGMPMKNASGAMSASDSAILARSGKAIRAANSGGSARM